MARYRVDGNIEFLGRVDDQVKIRGFRIELGEIEAVLSQHPAVGQAVVMAREDRPGDKRLVAYLVKTQGQRLAINNLRNYLNGKLPRHMVPSTFILLDAMPLTANGKIDRRALPALGLAKPDNRRSFVPPTLTLHYQLISIWEELLDIKPIGIQDNFFYLGGHLYLLLALLIASKRSVGKDWILPLCLLTPLSRR